MGKGMIRVNRGDGRLLQFRESDVNKYLKDNPGASLADQHDYDTVRRSAAQEQLEAEAAARPDLPDVENMLKPDLEDLARELNVDISEAKNNDERKAAINAALQPKFAEESESPAAANEE